MAVYDPESPASIEDVGEELRRISEALSSENDAYYARELHVEPEKPRDHLLVYADGTDWNPGSGAGWYYYAGATWVPMDTTGTLLTRTDVTETTAATTSSTIYNCLGAGITLTLPAVATAGDGFWCYVRNEDGTNTVTIDADGAETIDGALTLTLPVESTVLLQTDGVDWIVVFQSLIVEATGGGAGSAGLLLQVETAAFTVDASETLYDVTNAVTVTLPAAATAGDGYWFYIKNYNTDSDKVTVDPDGTETVDGELTYSVYPEHTALFHTNGTAWFVAYQTPFAAKLVTPDLAVTDDLTPLVTPSLVMLPDFGAGMRVQVVNGYLILYDGGNNGDHFWYSTDAETWTKSTITGSTLTGEMDITFNSESGYEAYWVQTTDGESYYLTTTGAPTGTWATATNGSAGNNSSISSGVLTCLQLTTSTSVPWKYSDQAFATWSDYTTPTGSAFVRQRIAFLAGVDKFITNSEGGSNTYYLIEDSYDDFSANYTTETNSWEFSGTGVWMLDGNDFYVQETGSTTLYRTSNGTTWTDVGDLPTATDCSMVKIGSTYICCSLVTGGLWASSDLAAWVQLNSAGAVFSSDSEKYFGLIGNSTDAVVSTQNTVYRLDLSGKLWFQ